MDSVSQLLLGASVTTAVMGRKARLWQSALVGAVCGTLPDLDVFIDHGDAIRNMTFHRTESHSLLFLTLISPVLAWLIAGVLKAKAEFPRWWVAVWLALITHPLLDLMTVYGTQLGLPFTDFPYAIGSMFIVDPLYTLPLLAGIVLALLLRGERGRRWNNRGLALSTGYLAWSMLAQAWVTHKVEASLAQQGIVYEKLLVTPTALNTLVWRVVSVTDEAYREGYYSLFSPSKPLETQRYPRDPALREQVRGDWYVERVAWFSQGVYNLRQQKGGVQVIDLRMGEEPSYSFTFQLGPLPLDHQRHLPTQQADSRPSLSTMWQQFLQRL